MQTESGKKTFLPLKHRLRPGDLSLPLICLGRTVSCSLGVGERTAIAILTDMPDVSNFEKAEQFAAFAGITPAHFESGTSVKGQSHISKIGAGRLRKILYMSAINVKNHNPHFKNFVERLQQKVKPPKVITRAIMRKLLVIFFGMLKNSTAFDQKLAFKP